MIMDVAKVLGWEAHCDRFIEGMWGCFRRCDLRHRATAYIRGLMGRLQRKNGWQSAEYVGDATPHGFQRLLDRAQWDADDVRDALMQYVRMHLLSERDHGVLIVDETGVLKKGDE